MRLPTLIVSEILPFLFSIASIEKRLQLDFHLGDPPPPRINTRPLHQLESRTWNEIAIFFFFFFYFTTIEEEEERRARARGGGGGRIPENAVRVITP